MNLVFLTFNTVRSVWITVRGLDDEAQDRPLHRVFAQNSNIRHWVRKFTTDTRELALISAQITLAAFLTESKLHAPIRPRCLRESSISRWIGVTVFLAAAFLGFSSTAKAGFYDSIIQAYLDGTYGTYSGYQTAPLLGYADVWVSGHGSPLLANLTALRNAGHCPGVQLNMYGAQTADIPPGAPLWPGAIDPNVATDGRDSVPNLLDALTYTGQLGMISCDLEPALNWNYSWSDIENDLTEIRTLLNGSNYAADCRLGNYDYAAYGWGGGSYTQGYMRFWVDDSGYLNSGSTYDELDDFTRNAMVGEKRVLDISMPVCYFRDAGVKLHTGVPGVTGAPPLLSTLPNDRAAIFYQALTRASDAGLNRASGQWVIPYVGDFVIVRDAQGNPWFPNAPKMGFADRVALLSHLRLRRMNGFNHFATPQTASDLGVTQTALANWSFWGWTYGLNDDNAELKESGGMPWLNQMLTGINPGSSNMLTYGNPTKERDGVMVSGCLEANGTNVIVIVSNLSGASVTVGGPDRPWSLYFGANTPPILSGKTLTVPYNHHYYREVTPASGSSL